MNIKLAGIASALLAAAIIAAPAAQSDDMNAIDCSGSTFAFSADGYNVDCERSSDQVRAGGSCMVNPPSARLRPVINR